MATITYSDGTTEEHYEPFNPDYTDWQFVSLAVVSNKREDNTLTSPPTISKITVAAVYDYNCNTMYFDNICLTVEPAQTYKYDDEGNIQNVTDDNANTSVMEYYENGIDLKNYTAPTGELFEYTYDNKHQITKADKTAGTNTQSAAYTYDTYGNIKTVTLTSSTASGLQITSSAAYTDYGNFLSKTVNELGKETNYNYNSVTKLLTFVENANSVRTAYIYDNRDRVTTIYIDSDEDNVADTTEAQVDYVYTNNRLTGIDNSKTAYTITYNTFGRISAIKAGSNTLATYTYAASNGKLNKLTYGNGDYEEYVYDYLDRLVSVKYNGDVKYSIEIDANNRLYSLTEGNTTHYYEYDSIGRLTRGWQEDANGNITLAVENTYDEFGRSNGSTYALPDKTQTYGIRYKEDSNLISSYIYPAGSNVYRYDGFDRLTQKIHTNLFFSSYTYVTDDSGNTSNLISRFTYTKPDFTNDRYEYTYDNLGNITSISKNSSVILSYEYDSLGQLTRENNVNEDYTIIFIYDTAGNLIAKSELPYTTEANPSVVEGDITSYTYGNSSWGDLLTNFNGTSITYDTIGNPLKWRNSSSMTWEGRQLSYQTFANSDRIGYFYNSDGIRRRKAYLYKAYSAVKAHDYVLDGTKIIKETITDGLTGNNYTLYYFYDESGVAGFEYNGVNYYFVKNIQGDVIEICNWDNGSVVQYTYDAWGKVLSVTGSLASTVGQYNPFRYRSYYYDTETGFYYLNSRYYDPEVGRFINADGYVSTGQGIVGHNMFAYCNNNPVMFSDDSGYAIRATTKVICDGGSREPYFKYLNDKSVVTLFFDATKEVVSNVKEDIDNFDIDNTNEQAVLDSNYFSAYKGKLTINIPFDRSASFGVLFIDPKANADDVRHEYGHTKQLDELGMSDYFWCIGIPSMFKWGDDKYYNNPQEVVADIEGGVLSRSHTQEQIDAGYQYLEDSKNYGIFAWRMFLD